MAQSPLAHRRYRPSGRGALLLAAGILSWVAEARGGFDGWRGDFNSQYESPRPSFGFYGDHGIPGSGWSGWSDWRWHWARSGTWIRVGIEGEYLYSLAKRRNYPNSWSHGSIDELEVGVPFGDSGTGSQIQFGVFPIRPGEGADLFGNYLARYQPYPGEKPYPPRQSDSLGSTGEPGEGMRVAWGRSGDPLRSEFLVLEDHGDVSFLGYLDGALPDGFGWGLGMGWRHALAWKSGERSEDRTIWARTESGYLPIAFAQDSGMAYSDSGGITAKGWALSARLHWTRTAEALGPFGAFGEAALLGIGNQPLLYEDRWRRWAATAGAYLPTWGLFQVCLIQMEWRPGAYGIGDAVKAHSAETYLQPADAASAWSYAALLGRDFGRHWALRGSVAYAPRVWSTWINEVYDPAIEPAYPFIHRGKRELALRLRAVFRFGARN